MFWFVENFTACLGPVRISLINLSFFICYWCNLCLNFSIFAGICCNGDNIDSSNSLYSLLDRLAILVGEESYRNSCIAYCWKLATG